MNDHSNLTEKLGSIVPYLNERQQRLKCSQRKLHNNAHAPDRIKIIGWVQEVFCGG